ncbi:MAG: glycosyltransferase [Spirochaetaceae bacterium]
MSEEERDEPASREHQERRTEARGVTGTVSGVVEPGTPVIAQFNDSFRPVMDGVAICTENYAKWLNHDHESTIVITPGIPEYQYNQDFAVYTFASMPFLPMRPFRLGLPFLDPIFQRQLDGINFKLIHSHAPFVTGFMARKIATERGVPHISTFHSKYHEDFRRVFRSQTIVKELLKQVVAFYESADAVWAPNKSTAETLRSYGYRGEIDIVPSGTDISAPSAEELAQYRATGWELFKSRVGPRFRLEGFDQAPVFLFVGQHRWEKNLDLVVEALDHLNRRGGDFRMIFVGTGYAVDQLRREVQRRDLEEKVAFVGVVVDRERIKGLYALADLFLFPSLYDTVGLVVREAAAFGIPSILVKGSSATEGMEDGREAFFTGNSADEMGRLLGELSRDMDRIRRVGEEARRRLNLSWRSVVAQVYRKYQAILADRSP